MPPRILVVAPLIVMLSACQHTKLGSIPRDIANSPIQCSTLEKEYALRKWSKRNSNWIKKRLSEHIQASATSEETLKKFKKRIEVSKFSGCAVGYTVSSATSQFMLVWSDHPPITTELKFGDDGNELCLHNYLGQLRYPPGRPIWADVAFDPAAARFCRRLNKSKRPF